MESERARGERESARSRANTRSGGSLGKHKETRETSSLY